MMMQTMSRMMRNKMSPNTFPKLPPNKYNSLWSVSQMKLMSLSMIELLPMMSSLIFKFGTSSLLAMPTIFWIFQNSNMLEEKEKSDHLTMFKALDVDNNNMEYFITVSLMLSMMIKTMTTLVWLLWLPLKMAMLFYLLDYLNYDVSYYYHKMNNLSLGMLDWYYRTLMDFLESLMIKYDFYMLDHASQHIKKI